MHDKKDDADLAAREAGGGLEPCAADVNSHRQGRSRAIRSGVWRQTTTSGTGEFGRAGQDDFPLLTRSELAIPSPILRTTSFRAASVLRRMDSAPPSQANLAPESALPRPSNV